MDIADTECDVVRRPLRIIGLTSSSPSRRPAEAATAKKYVNCTALNKVYKGGVAKKGAKDKRASGTARYRPHVSNALYEINKKMDRDKDGIACER
jgi:hypothetical protein